MLLFERKCQDRDRRSSHHRPTCKIDTAEGGALQHHPHGAGRRRKVHGLLPNYDRGARLASTLTCAGLGGVLQWRWRQGEMPQWRWRRGEKALRPHPIGTKTEAGVYHWLWRCMTSTIKINEWRILTETIRDWTCQGPSRRTKELHPAEKVFSSGGAGYGKGTTSAIRIGE